jgi:predicted nucleic acid-binding protein
MLVDSSVWIDFFAGRQTIQAGILEASLAQREDLYICGVILTEILQGVRHPRTFTRAKSLLESLLYLEMGKSTFILAAEIHRGLHRRGITVRKPVDCMIAAAGIEHGIPLLHNDRDFDPIQKYFELRTPSV